MSSTMTRRQLMGTGAAGLCAMALGGTLPAAQRKRQPNILIITTDQQRVDAMSAVGNTWVKTPHMDSLVANGVYFMNSYCSFPLCSPSRASLHTSRMPHEIGVDRNNLPILNAPLSGEVFREAGYDTGYAGKWHCPSVYPTEGIAGFEVVNTTTRQGKLAQAVDEATMTAGIEFIRRKREKPFLAVVSFINPHDICLPAGGDSPLLGELWQRYQPPAGAELPPLPANALPTQGLPEGFNRGPKHDDWDENQWRRFGYAYRRMMEDVDRQVGLVLQALRETGQENNTLVIFTSDHGEGLGSHRWTGKMMYYQEEAAVPLIVSWKGVTPAGRIDREHLVSTLDVLPTICDYAGVRGPAVMRGKSLRPVIEKPQQPGHEYVVSEMAGSGGRSFMLRTKKYKYMFFPPASGQKQEMFFDLQADPGEMKNLIAQPALATEIERHRKLLADWNKLTEEASHTIVPGQAGKAKNKAKQNKAKQRNK
ncbi:MAG: sulfatase-like hydrolase/transferase [Planctomycetes bacterium]|jgi:arylsulfatase A-like enzyme|nr:sulfatase-like hydrolase/transferase [Planctomycetota bacterium]